MGYIKTNWTSGDIIDETKLNNIEDGVEYLSSSLDMINTIFTPINNEILTLLKGDVNSTIKKVSIDDLINEKDTVDLGAVSGLDITYRIELDDTFNVAVKLDNDFISVLNDRTSGAFNVNFLPVWNNIAIGNHNIDIIVSSGLNEIKTVSLTFNKSYGVSSTEMNGNESLLEIVNHFENIKTDIEGVSKDFNDMLIKKGFDNDVVGNGLFSIRKNMEQVLNKNIIMTPGESNRLGCSLTSSWANTYYGDEKTINNYLYGTATLKFSLKRHSAGSYDGFALVRVLRNNVEIVRKEFTCNTYNAIACSIDLDLEPFDEIKIATKGAVGGYPGTASGIDLYFDAK